MANSHDHDHNSCVSCYFKASTVNPTPPHGKPTSTIEHAIAHNRRTTQARHGARLNIDPTRTRLNYCLAGDSNPNAIVQRVRAAMKEHHAPKNAPHAHEIVIAMPASWQGDTRALFRDSIPYLEGVFGAENLLSADVHLDEANPHMHVLFMPLEHCEKKGRVVWRNRIGDNFKPRRRALYVDFFTVVGRRHGIDKPLNLSGNEAAALALAVIDVMQRSGDGATTSKAWDSIKDAIKANPKPPAIQLGINLTPFAKVKNTQGGFGDVNAIKNSRAKAAQKIGKDKNPHSVYGGFESIDLETGELKATEGVKHNFGLAVKNMIDLTRSAWLTMPCEHPKTRARTVRRFSRLSERERLESAALAGAVIASHDATRLELLARVKPSHLKAIKRKKQHEQGN